ncbi:hypothetical protein JWG42_09590 [Desulfoprunum benzoelyticum]|uniref:Uncharacterized protein n=1 Tax=Desulfoprunum benzoelyticum TaxID=1506996 RepID=A0A840UP04_9BACT|nr:histidine kinase [Desulfoprunum benzoelyticum]MBB5347987.1 hypothetical protein [Desulfoprunum benzoelyticum]MBM9530400.1 hypothetical protein [Desulfoprunum benzoelyticum]
MTEKRRQLRERLQELEEQITETKRRLPAHSVKPPVMMDLLALEDERDFVLDQLERLRGA